MQYQMLQAAHSSQSSQDLMLAQQQLYSSQLRYQQTAQQAGSMYGYNGVPSYGMPYGYGGYSSPYVGMFGSISL
jgi:hypothetical protein